MECNSMSISQSRCDAKVLACFVFESDLPADVEVNVLDATGDRILAGEELSKEAVLCAIWSLLTLGWLFAGDEVEIDVQ